MKLNDAVAVRDSVRAYYAQGKKSGNKVYADRDFIADADWAAYSQRASVRMLAQRKAGNRNDNQALSAQHRPAPPNNQTLLSWARAVWNGGAKDVFASGNCGEMATVAGALCVDRHGVNPGDVFYAQIGAPSDHVFCLVDARPALPAWGTVTAMGVNTGAAASGALVIDPWMNIACAAEDYWKEAQKKLREWGQDGKRIAWDGPKGGGWYNPDGAYLLAFARGPLEYHSLDTMF
jgi:hypothetical protein